MSEEIKRRLMNADRDHKEEERAEILRHFLIKMANSGYGPPTRQEVLKSGIRRYFRRLFMEQTGGPKLYRTEDQLKEGRRFKQLLTKRWYKPGRGGKAAKLEKEALWEEKESKRRGRKAQKEKGGAGMTLGKAGEAGITSGKAGGGEETSQGEGGEDKGRAKVVEGVVFVPFTPESALREELQRVEDTLTAEMNTPGIRFVERGRNTVVEVLGRNNLWSKEGECNRKVCPQCWGRTYIAHRKEMEAMALVSGEGTTPVRKEGRKEGRKK